MSSIPIVNHPSSSVTYLAPETGLYDADQIRERKLRLTTLASRKRAVCFAMDAFWMELYPQWMQEAGAGLVKHAIIRNHLARNPLLAVQLLMTSYDETQPMLERAVLASGEATVPLMRAFDEGKIVPAQPTQLYEEALLQHPFWALRYLHSPAGSANVASKRAQFASRLLARCAATAATSPQAALTHLLMNQSQSVDPYREQLLSDPMVAYLASRMLGVRGFSARADEVKKLDPRWAMHMALWGGFDGGAATEVIEDEIAKHPGWTGEYVARDLRRQKDWAWASEMYNRTERHFQARHAVTQESPSPWSDYLWALLDRISLLIEGKDPKVTISASYARSKTLLAAAATKADASGGSESKAETVGANA